MISEASTDNDIRKMAGMASVIWHEAFAGIITVGQIGYMLEKFQSYHAMKDQMENHNYRYFIMSVDGREAGYCGVQPCDDNSLYLSKMYLLHSARGKGLFKAMADRLVEICRELGLGSIWLTVNKNNGRAIAAYEKYGFKNIKSIVTDIGNGFVMDDYVFELKIS